MNVEQELLQDGQVFFGAPVGRGRRIAVAIALEKKGFGYIDYAFSPALFKTNENGLAELANKGRSPTEGKE